MWLHNYGEVDTLYTVGFRELIPVDSENCQAETASRIIKISRNISILIEYKIYSDRLTTCWPYFCVVYITFTFVHQLNNLISQKHIICTTACTCTNISMYITVFFLIRYSRKSRKPWFLSNAVNRDFAKMPYFLPKYPVFYVFTRIFCF